MSIHKTLEQIDKMQNLDYETSLVTEAILDDEISITDLKTLATYTRKLETALKHYANKDNWDIRENRSSNFATIPTVVYLANSNGTHCAKEALKD